MQNTLFQVFFMLQSVLIHSRLINLCQSAAQSCRSSKIYTFIFFPLCNMRLLSLISACFQTLSPFLYFLLTKGLLLIIKAPLSLMSRADGRTSIGQASFWIVVNNMPAKPYISKVIKNPRCQIRLRSYKCL